MPSPQEAEASMIANLKGKTGKTLEQWVKIVAASKLTRHGEIVTMLKDEHEMGHGYANLVAHKHFKSDAGSAGDTADLVAAQYAGEKAALKPIYDAIIMAVGAFGTDAEIAPKNAYVSLRRSKQFAIVQPSTKARVDVGINLKGEKTTARLEASGSFNSMVSHRVRIEKAARAGGVDKELIAWLKKAYEAA